jgi:hypothetical protein
MNDRRVVKANPTPTATTFFLCCGYALCPGLSWTHYLLLLRVEDRRAWEWYMVEAATQNWSIRALERQIDTLYYEVASALSFFLLKNCR